MDLKQIKELMDKLEASKLKKLVYKKGDEELHLEKESLEVPSSYAPPPRSYHQEERVQHQEPAAHKAPRPEEAKGNYITSPMVGTFYASPGPGQPSFVKVGDHVTEDTIVCIVEAMKVLNEVKAGIKGTIAEILPENAEPVEFGTRLFRVT